MLWTALHRHMSAMNVGVIFLIEVCAVHESLVGTFETYRRSLRMSANRNEAIDHLGHWYSDSSQAAGGRSKSLVPAVQLKLIAEQFSTVPAAISLHHVGLIRRGCSLRANCLELGLLFVAQRCIEIVKCRAHQLDCLQYGFEPFADGDEPRRGSDLAFADGASKPGEVRVRPYWLFATTRLGGSSAGLLFGLLARTT